MQGYVLEFHKRGKDGSGKCNAFYTGQRSNELYGVVFDIDAHERSLLDKVERLGEGYDNAHIETITSAGTVEAFTYVAQPGVISDSVKRYTWYHMYVVQGAR